MLGTLRAWKHKVLDGVASAPRAAVVTEGRRESLKDKCEPEVLNIRASRSHRQWNARKEQTLQA